MNLSPLAVYALVALAALALFVLAAWGHLRFWSKRLTLELDYASVEQIVTPDGATIELRRTPRPEGTIALDLPPILMIHGIAANHRNNDLHPDFSLARYLVALGHDVWLLTLRSGRPARSRLDRRRIRFAAMVEQDVPIAVDAVLERTHAAKLDLVGFSMGGMLLYAAMGRTVPEAKVRRAVLVGSPGRVGAPRWIRPFLRRLPRSFIPTTRLRFGARAIAFASEWLSTPFHHQFYNPHNVSKGLTRAILVNMVEDIPGPLNADLAEWAGRDGQIRSRAGVPVLEGLGEVRTPALFLAGAADRLAPVPAVRKAFDAWGKQHPETDKTFLIFGKEVGHLEDYGHGDLAVGAKVVSDVFAPIGRFLGA